MIHVQGSFYEVIQNVRDGWNPDAFKERYSEVLAKYDYIVGDWGYDQLRLRGFFDDQNKKAKAAFDAKISTLDEYIHEYCNFGCAYFVVKKGNPPEGYKPDEYFEQENDNNEQEDI
jgi:uncharacterized protein YutD